MIKHTVGGACLLVFGLAAWGLATTEKEFRETRVHWSIREVANNFPPEKRDRLLKSKNVPQVTIIKKDWFPLITKSNPPRAGEATRKATIVLLDAGVDGNRFGWWEDRDYAKARRNYRLVVWYPDGKKEQIVVEVEYPVHGENFETWLAETRKEQSKGTMPSDDELLMTLNFADRKWTLPVGEWRHGEFDAKEKTWLRSVTSERLKDALRILTAIGPGLPELQMASDLIGFPILEIYNHTYDPSANLIRPRAKPDCDFDASFGEPCSMEDQLEYNLRKNPQVAPPPPQQTH